ncbi:MAG TPA: hypothetical protein VED40_21730 [Azospirillaceae bacterium]|nr:hypothetical protein [Azospirillaceae bacterium]
MRGEYGRAGLVGVLTPQANMTVEPELSVLMPPDVGMLAARLVCPARTLQERLAVYLEELPRTLERFDDAPLDLVAFACTGSSYILGPEREAAVLARCNRPVLTAASAIADTLAELRARRVLLVSPYPGWLTESALAHWTMSGIEVTHVVSPPAVPKGLHPIYAQTSAGVLAALEGVDRRGVDAVLVTGTGMPTLAALATLNDGKGPPALSSNLCLAWRMAARLGLRADWLSADAPWKARLAARHPSAGAPA